MSLRSYKGFPFCSFNFIRHLNVYLLIDGFKHAHEVEICLTEFEVLDLSKAKDRGKFGFDASFLIHLPHHSILNALSCLHETTRELPKPFDNRLPFLNR